MTDQSAVEPTRRRRWFGRGEDGELPLSERLSALRAAVEVADGRLELLAVGDARVLLGKAGARRAFGDGTVVALAGATGSGKSTLFNALSEAEVSSPGVTRPTTGVAHATVVGPDPQDDLLDWLQVPRRHRRPDAAPAGLVLLDLPDHDSIRVEHRLEVDRLVELVDVLIWVLDPEKYADAAVHDRYLRPLAGHAGSLLVVLNQADRLTPEALAACRADLRRLLDAEGLAAAPLLTVSARTGAGLPELRDRLAGTVAHRRAADERLTADIRRVGGALLAHTAEADPPAGRSGSRGGAIDETTVADALAGAAGVPTVVQAVERSARRAGTATTGWPPVRWLRRARPDPLEAVHLASHQSGRTSLPPATERTVAALDLAVRDARDTVADGLPTVWRDELRRASMTATVGLADRLDRAVGEAVRDGGDDPAAPAAWQRAVGAVQWVLLVVALAGTLWLLGLMVLGWLQLDDIVPLPRVAGLPLPTLLLAGGLLAGLLLAAVCRPLVARTARRRAARVQQRLTSAVAAVAVAEIGAPLAAVRADHDRFRAAAQRAAR
ncbi:GTP-binding protein HSR1 [Nakamurella flava]|uniref:GTP-binding protein HSR1 n=1 Tax=Nakamurella flava TaxID=2576308 RepID=A0A4V6CVI2_9ACTN|nr:GTPase [Nakamurella flava]TKV57645.1 GTP-binding protein HSR1 [Nakamurella flava]